MAQLMEAKRIVIIANIALKSILLDRFLELGAKGYHAVVCFGKGRHEALGDLVTGEALIRIEIVTTPEVAEQILQYVHDPRFRNDPLMAYMDTVQVRKTDQIV